MHSHANLILRSAQTGDHTAAVDVLVNALRDRTVLRWAGLDPSHCAPQLRPYFAILLEHAAIHGSIRIADAEGAPVGVAVWFPYPLDPGVTDVHDLPTGDTDGVLFTDAAMRLRGLEQALKERHPVRTPHHYLANLGTCAQQQGPGVEAALIGDHHIGLGGPQTARYLEAGDGRDPALYRRLGYTDHGRPITVDGCPPVQPMWCQPVSVTT